MQYGNITSSNLIQNEAAGAASRQVAAFLDWNKRILVRGLGTVSVWARRSRQRGELRQVLGRGDHFFQDIGVDRATLHNESGKWFWQE